MDVTTTESEKASLRHCVCDQGLLTRCDGSARLKQGEDLGFFCCSVNRLLI